MRTYQNYLNDYNRQRDNFLRRFENPYSDSFRLSRPTPNISFQNEAGSAEVPDNPNRTMMGRVFDALLLPNYAIAGFFDGIADGQGGRTPLQGFWEGVKAGNPIGKGYEAGKTTFSDVLETSGWKPESLGGKIAKGTTGFVLDVLLDPLTYLTGGGSAAIRGTGRAGKGVAGVKQVLKEAESASSFNKYFDEALSKGLKPEAAAKEAERQVSALRLTEPIGTHVTDEAAEQIIARQNRLSGKQMTKEELKSAAERLADEYNSLFGIYDARKPQTVTFGIGNLPFMPKSLQDKVWTIGSAKPIAEFSDRVGISKIYGSARDFIYGSKLGRLFSNNAKLYEAVMKDPAALWHKTRFVQLIGGQDLSKVQKDRLIMETFEDLDLTPAENKELLDLLQSNKFQRQAESYIKQQRRIEERNARNELRERKKKATNQLQELIRAREKYAQMVQHSKKDAAAYKKRLDELERAYEMERAKLEHLKYAEPEVTEKYRQMVTDEVREIFMLGKDNRFLPEKLNEKQTLAHLARIVRSQSQDKSIAMRSAKREADKLREASRKANIRIDPSSVESAVSDSFIKQMEKSHSFDANLAFTRALSAYLYGDPNELARLSSFGVDTLSEMVLNNKSAEHIRNYIERRPTVYSGRASLINSHLASRFNYTSWQEDGAGIPLALAMGVPKEEARSYAKKHGVNKLLEMADDMIKKGKIKPGTWQHESITRVTEQAKSRAKIRHMLFNAHEDEMKLIIKEYENKKMLGEVLGAQIPELWGGLNVNAIIHDLDKTTVRPRRDIEKLAEELAEKQGKQVQKADKGKGKDGKKDDKEKRKKEPVNRGNEIFELYEHREYQNLHPSQRTPHDPYAKFGHYKEKGPSYEEMLQMLNEKGLVDLTRTKVEHPSVKKNYEILFERMKVFEDHLYGKGLENLKNSQLALVMKRAAQQTPSSRFDMGEAFVKRVIDNANRLLYGEQRMARERMLRVDRKYSAQDVYRMSIDEYVTSRLNVIKKGLKESQVDSISPQYKEAMKKLEAEWVPRIEEHKSLMKQMNERYKKFFDENKPPSIDELSKIKDEIEDITLKLENNDAFLTWLELNGRKEYDTESVISKLMKQEASSERLGEIAVKLRESFIKAGGDEVKAGLMTKGQFEANMFQYLPRIPTKDGEKFFNLIKEDLPLSERKRVSPDIGFGEAFNPHSMGRTTSGRVEEINAYFRDKYYDLIRGKNVFSEDVAEIYLSRMLKHNEIMYDDKYARTMINEFGKEIVNGVVEDGYKAVMNYGDLRRTTKDLASMRTSLHITNDIITFVERHGSALREEALRRNIDPQKYLDEHVSRYIEKKWTQENIQEFWEVSHKRALKATGIPGSVLDREAIPMVELNMEQINKLNEVWDKTYNMLEKSLRKSYASAIERFDSKRLAELKDSFEKMRIRTRPNIKQVNSLIVDQANQARRLAIARDESRFLQLYDKFLHFIKVNQTIVSPMFHTRNKISNIFNNWLVLGQDVANVNWHIAATQVARFKGDPRKVKEYIAKNPKKREKIFEPIPIVNPHKSLTDVVDVSNGLSWTDAYDLAYHYGVIDSGIFARDVGARVGSDGILGKLRIGDISLDPTDTKNFVLYDIGTEIGTAVENSDRVIGFVSALRQGYSVQEAAELSKKALFDYSDLTAFEHNVMKRIFPYYTWLRKNARLQVGTLIEKPEKLRMVAKVLSGVEGMSNSDERLHDAFLSDWARDWTQLPFVINGKPVIMSGNLPYMDFSRIPDPHDPVGSVRDVFSQMTPAIKNPVEMALNYNAFFDDKIARSPEQIPEKYGNYLAGQFSLYNFARGFMKDSDAEVGLHALSNATGVKMSPYTHVPREGDSEEESPIPRSMRGDSSGRSGRSSNRFPRSQEEREGVMARQQAILNFLNKRGFSGIEYSRADLQGEVNRPARDYSAGIPSFSENEYSEEELQREVNELLRYTLNKPNIKQALNELSATEEEHFTTSIERLFRGFFTIEEFDEARREILNSNDPVKTYHRLIEEGVLPRNIFKPLGESYGSMYRR